MELVLSLILRRGIFHLSKSPPIRKLTMKPLKILTIFLFSIATILAILYFWFIYILPTNEMESNGAPIEIPEETEPAPPILEGKDKG